MQVPMSSPDLTKAEIAAVNHVVNTRYLSIGPEIQAFEAAFADYVGTAHAAGVNSGTSGLHLTLIASGVGENDLVITTPFSFIASANSVLYERSVPVFVDVDEKTGNIDPALVVQAVEDIQRGHAEKWLPPALADRADKYRLRAILPVHAFGQPADMDPIMEVARQHDLVVIEDACEAIGAEYKGRKAGTIGEAAVFAFYPNKQMTTAEGGMIVTDNDTYDGLYRSLRNQGRDVFDTWLDHTRLGYNYRMSELSAALGRVQIGRIEELLAKRDRVASWYNEALASIPGVARPCICPNTTRMSWFVYVIRLDDGPTRDRLVGQLKERGIASRPYFTPIHLQPFYRERFGYSRGMYPATELLGDTSLALPFSGVMTQEQVQYVVDTLGDLLA